MNGKGGDSFAEFLLGDLFTSTVAVQIASAHFQRNAWAAFADDTWKVRPNLTLSLGLRYELTPPWTDLDGNLFTVNIPHLHFTINAPQADWPYFVRQGNCSDPYQGINIRWTQTRVVCNNGLLADQLLKTSYKDFAPRAGISWSPNTRIFTMQSGMPGTLTVPNGSGARYAYDRPLYTGISPYLSNPTPSRWWSLDSYVQADPGQFGNVGRNTMIGPRLTAFDFEIHKNLRMPYKEGHIVQFRLEASNALNHPAWGMPNTGVLSGRATRTVHPGRSPELRSHHQHGDSDAAGAT